MTDDDISGESASAAGESRRRRIIALRVLPAAAVALTVGAGVLGRQAWLQHTEQAARTESLIAARETTAAMLTYRADTVEQDLMAVRDRLTGSFVGSYTDLVSSTIVPAAREKKISVVATVKAAAPVSATAQHAVALLFVDNSVTMGGGPPTTNTSGVRVSLDNVGGRWLVSGFEPV